MEHAKRYGPANLIPNAVKASSPGDLFGPGHGTSARRPQLLLRYVCGLLQSRLKGRVPLSCSLGDSAIPAHPSMCPGLGPSVAEWQPSGLSYLEFIVPGVWGTARAACGPNQERCFEHAMQRCNTLKSGWHLTISPASWACTWGHILVKTRNLKDAQGVGVTTEGIVKHTLNLDVLDLNTGYIHKVPNLDWRTSDTENV